MGRFCTNCSPDRIRTYDLRFRKPLLYPAELPNQLTDANNGKINEF